jgi:tetratricopeptide (TPR) repeat protein
MGKIAVKPLVINMIFNLTVVRLAIVVSLGTVSVAGFGVASAQSPLDADTPVATLVKRLGAEDFVQRQQASKLLFEKGASIVPELESVPLSSNPEVNQRVGDLVKLLSAGPEAVKNKETFDAIINFENAELETRKQLLEKLLSGEQYDMYFHMVQKMPDDQAEEIFSESRMQQLVRVLCDKGRWDDIQAILSHRLTWKYEPNLCGLYHQTMGTLDVYIDKMKREVDDSEFADAKQLTTLIGLLRAEGEYDAAMKYAKRFGSAELVSSYENQILMESGNWQALADRAVLSDDPIESDRYFLCDRMTYPMVKYWGGSEDEFLKAVERVTEKSIADQNEKRGGPKGDGDKNDDGDIEGDGENKIEFAVDPILQQIHLLTLNWQEAKKGIKFSQDEATAQILAIVNQYELLLDELNLGHDFASHQRWATAKQAELEKLTDRFATARGRTGLKDNLNKVNNAIGYYLGICDLFAELGLEREAILFVRQLYQQIYPVAAMEATRLDLIGRVADYGDAEALWDFIENAGLSNVQLKSLVDVQRPQFRGLPEDKYFVLFGFKNQVARFVYEKLSPKIDDRIELLKRVAHVVNYQLKPSDISSDDGGEKAEPRLSLDANVALIEHSYGSDECWKISQIYAYHQRPEAKQWRMRAATNGDVRAIKRMADELFDQGDYLNAAAMFEQEYKLAMSPLPLSRAAQSYGLAGNRLKEKRINFRAYVQSDFMYDSNFIETFVTYLEEDHADLIADRLRYRISTRGLSAHSVLTHVGWQVLEKSDPVAAANFAKMRLLFSRSAESPVRLMSFALSAHTVEATAAVVEGDYEKADRILKRLLDFSPATPSVAEKTVVQLDLAGETQRADAVVDRLKGFYHELLADYPTSSTHCNNYAWVLACARRNADAAVRHAHTAVAGRPNSPGFIDTLAESYFAAGNIDKAVEIINHAASIEPEKAYYRNQRKKYEAAR